MKKNKCAIYCRCSTVNQNLDIQRNDLTRYAQMRELDVVEIFEDFGVSGMKDKRPSLDRMLTMARQRKFNYILIWRLDRLGRNTSHLLNLIDEFQDLQISLVSQQEGFDLSTYLGRVIATILAALSNFEAELTRERVIVGINNARKRGKVLGRPKKYVDTEGILKMRNAGCSFAVIGKKYNLSNGFLHTLFKNELNHTTGSLKKI